MNHLMINYPSFKYAVLILGIFPLLIIFGSRDTDPSTSSTATTSPATSNEDEGWLIPKNEIWDILGKEGIPSIDNPDFAPASEVEFIPGERMVIGIKIDDVIRAYPHQILDQHEIVNDQIGGRLFSIVWCPLTGTGMSWNGEIGREIDGSRTEFGVSGRLFRNNLIAYDRRTDSYWSQMQLRGVNGIHSGFDIETYQVVETRWETWKQLYPESEVLTTNTGFDREYDGYLYGRQYSTDHDAILFPVKNRDDRLENKDRVHGIIDNVQFDTGANVTVFEIAQFGAGVNLIRDSSSFLVAGSSELDFAVAFKLENDNASLYFEPVHDQLPVIMQDNEGNFWDIFGYAVEGPRKGALLPSARSYTGYWFAWVDFFPSLDIFGEFQ